MGPIIGTRVRAYREALGMGVRDLARAAATAPGYISELEHGLKPRPSAVTLYRLAEALHVGIYDLLSAPQSARTNPALPRHREAPTP